ncbi:unnamed protein product [Lactuca saligna]|uniref:Uncharacterized protein n=1 Tax=Lactuca saligna TaxID=75948 RepID=A0AA35YZ66_LACSI|nr:unnamed protein product [Lactuca saligna]
MQIAPDSVEPTKEVVHSKTGVFKRIKKIAHKSRSSSEISRSFSPSMIRNPHVMHKGDVLREVPILVSLSAKKQKVEDMVKHISKKQKKRLRKLVLNDESTEEEVVCDPLVPNSPEKSIVETLVVSS